MEKNQIWHYYFPTDVPGAPGKPDITNITRSTITIKWSPPYSDGGSPITNYILEKREAFAVRWVKATNRSIVNTSFTVDGLKEGAQYEFRVVAENKAGEGPPSDSTGQVVPKDAFSKYIQGPCFSLFFRIFSVLIW